MKRLLTSIVMLMLLLCGTAAAQWIHIYHLGVGHGDCTLITMRDEVEGTTSEETVAILIDVGKPPFPNKDALWAAIVQYLNRDGATKINYFVVSHIHADHMKVAGRLLEGLRGTAWVKGMKIIDRIYASGFKGVRHTWMTYPTDGIYKEYFDEIAFQKFGHWDPIPGKELLNFKKIKMKCVAANGYVMSDNIANPTFALQDGFGVDLPGPRDENDLSLAWVIQLNDFKYFTGGDLSGTTTGHCNVEGKLVDYFHAKYPQTATARYPYHFCAFKLSHHGSETSTNDKFVGYFVPSHGVVSARLSVFNGTRLPVETVITKMNNNITPLVAPSAAPLKYSCKLYYTFIPKTGDDPSSCYASRYWSARGSATTYRDIIFEVGKKPGDHDLNTQGPAAIQINIGKRSRRRSDLGTGVTIGNITWNTDVCNRH